MCVCAQKLECILMHEAYYSSPSRNSKDCRYHTLHALEITTQVLPAFDEGFRLLAICIVQNQILGVLIVPAGASGAIWFSSFGLVRAEALHKIRGGFGSLAWNFEGSKAHGHFLRSHLTRAYLPSLSILFGLRLLIGTGRSSVVRAWGALIISRLRMRPVRVIRHNTEDRE